MGNLGRYLAAYFSGAVHNLVLELGDFFSEQVDDSVCFVCLDGR